MRVPTAGEMLVGLLAPLWLPALLAIVGLFGLSEWIDRKLVENE